MRTLDWVVLIVSLIVIVGYGLHRSRGRQTIRDYILAGKTMPWWAMGLSIMATQASAITFIGTTGQGYVDGMRFVQFYFGLPIAAVILSITAVPLYHRLRVYTAYEYLEGRFDVKTRSLAALLFLVQRGLAAGLTIFAPALVLSVILGWDLTATNVAVGVLVIVYTAAGGTRAVSWTQGYQMVIIMGGMFLAFLIILWRLPEGVGLIDATRVAGTLGRMNAIDFRFDLDNRYNIWSGIIAGCFLQLSYFGTDQSQVARYLTGRSVTQSRMGLLVNGLVKVPMQFFILFVGAMVFVFYQFTAPPIFFNPVEVDGVRLSAHAERFAALEDDYRSAFGERLAQVEELVAASSGGNPARQAAAEAELRQADARMAAIREDAVAVLRANNPGMASDTNYVFLSFVVGYLPVGVVGLLIAAILFASMSSTASELNALASTSVVDLYRRLFRGRASEAHYVVASKAATVVWGLVAIGFAELFRGHQTLVEAVNIVGSLFYGTILGIFLAAFYTRRLGGAAVFVGAVTAELVVLAFHLLTVLGYFDLAYLWYNVIGCTLVLAVAFLVQPFLGGAPARRPPA